MRFNNTFLTNTNLNLILSLSVELLAEVVEND